MRHCPNVCILPHGYRRAGSSDVGHPTLQPRPCGMIREASTLRALPNARCRDDVQRSMSFSRCASRNANCPTPLLLPDAVASMQLRCAKVCTICTSGLERRKMRVLHAAAHCQIASTNDRTAVTHAVTCRKNEHLIAPARSPRLEISSLSHARVLMLL